MYSLSLSFYWSTYSSIYLSIYLSIYPIFMYLCIDEKTSCELYLEVREALAKDTGLSVRVVQVSYWVFSKYCCFSKNLE